MTVDITDLENLDPKETRCVFVNKKDFDKLAEICKNMDCFVVPDCDFDHFFYNNVCVSHSSIVNEGEMVIMPKNELKMPEKITKLFFSKGELKC